MSTYVGDLITEVRRDTENVDSSSTTGIDTEDFLRYMNYGLQRLQARIIQNNSTVFRKQHDFSIAADTSTYTIPDNVYLQESVIDVQYSRDGQETNFRELPEIGESYRNTASGGFVKAYTRRAGSIIVSPVPTEATGTLRVIYDRGVDRLEIRRGDVDGITVSSGTVTADTISLDATDDDADKIAERTPGHLSIVDRDGIGQVYAVPFTAYNSTTGDFTHSATAVESGKTPATGHYCTLGKYSSTHIHVLDSPDIERYVQLYCAVKIFRRDSSADAQEASRELAAVEKEIIETYAMMQKDEGNIQISDPDILFMDPWRGW
jgi:hypothetical protein